jgi:hypothetical protein
MGYITTEYINSLSDNKPTVFIETGTFKGGVPQMMLDDGTFNQWKKIYTIELNEEMCKIASKRYSLYEEGKPFDRDTDEKDETFNGRKEFFDGKLVLVQGDSAEKLNEVLSEINEPCVFWLDAHAGAKEGYARGEVDCPLIQELEAISKHSIKNHVITVDDASLLGQVQYNNGEVVCDYSDITKERVESILNNINPKFSVSYPSPFNQLMLVSLENENKKDETIQFSNF